MTSRRSRCLQLNPVLTAEAFGDASVFHRALYFHGVKTGNPRPFDDLTPEEQGQVRRRATDLEKRDLETREKLRAALDGEARV